MPPPLALYKRLRLNAVSNGGSHYGRVKYVQSCQAESGSALTLCK